MHHESEDHILFRSVRILEGACRALFFFTIFVLGLYFLGNYQEFLDSSQNLLLRVLKTVSLLTALVSLYYLLGLIIWGVHHRILMPGRTIFAFVAFGVSGALTFAANLILVILTPVIGGPAP